MDENEKPEDMGKVIQIDEARIRDHLGEMVRGTVEEALNAMLDARWQRCTVHFYRNVFSLVPSIARQAIAQQSAERE